MRWADMQRRQPCLAALGRERLVHPGVLLVATVRADGSPRVSPVEPLLLEDDLWLSMMWRSQKAEDLLRDPRVLVHSIVTSPDGTEGEVKMRGTVRHEEDRKVQRRYAAAVTEQLGWSPEPGRFHLFAVEISSVAAIRYDEPTGDQFVAIWPPPREFVRHGTSATSVGEPEPVRDLLMIDEGSAT